MKKITYTQDGASKWSKPRVGDNPMPRYNNTLTTQTTISPNWGKYMITEVKQHVYARSLFMMIFNYDYIYYEVTAVLTEINK